MWEVWLIKNFWKVVKLPGSYQITGDILLHFNEANRSLVHIRGGKIYSPESNKKSALGVRWRSNIGGQDFVVHWHSGIDWASLVAQLVKNPSAVRETWVQSLGWEHPRMSLTFRNWLTVYILTTETPIPLLLFNSKNTGFEVYMSRQKIIELFSG